MKDLNNTLKNDIKVAQKNVLSLRDAVGQYRLIIDSLMDSLGDAMLIVDKDFDVNDINLSFEKFFEIRESEFSGKPVHELFERIIQMFDEDSEKQFQELLKRVEDRENFISESLESTITNSNNQQKFLKVFTSPIYNNELGYIGRIWKFEDITREKKIDQMKTEFISIASHQLRTPLSAINGNVDMVLEGDYGEIKEDIRLPLGDVKSATKNLIDLVNSLLDVSRLEMGTVVPQKSEVNISDTIQSEIDLLKNLANKKEIKLQEDVQQGIIIQTDSKMIAEAVKNYISNSIKYTPDGGVIDIKLIKDDDGLLIFEVADNGLGVPEESRENLFGRFFRADNVLTENFEGTGLGLYYVKKTINALGGEVYFKPKEKGSIFGFLIKT